jgi:hypothetical protein
MKFLCLAYGAEKDWKALTAAEGAIEVRPILMINDTSPPNDD